MIKDLFHFGKADKLMWAGIGIFSIILIIAFSLFPMGAAWWSRICSAWPS